MSLSEEKIKELWRSRGNSGYLWLDELAFARTIEAAVRDELGAEIARLKAQQVGLQNINIMNQATMEGEIARLREANAELLHAFTDAYNELKERAKDEGDEYNCPTWNTLIAKHGGK